jgi:hypothetical protein
MEGRTMVSHKKVILAIVVVFVFFSIQSLSAQEKWGKVSKEILQMKTFTEDTSAKGVFLFDVADMEVGVNSSTWFLEMKRHVRIKILTEEGKDLANIKIPFWHKDKLDNIEAQTILPSGKKIKLKGNQIFEESVRNNWKQKVFAIPGVAIGSVVEYKYNFYTEYLTNLEPWYFQNSEYTQVSQLSIILYPQFSYNVFYQNVFGEDTSPTEEQIFLVGTGGKKVKKFTWHLEDIQPIKKEPFMRTVNDYRMAMFFQLLEYRSPYQYYKFIKTWDDLAEKMNQVYDDYIKGNGDFKAVLQSVVEDSARAEDKIRNIYNYVRDEIASEWVYTIYPKEKSDKVLEEKKGRLSDKNILLINLLREAGFEANPLLISTRSHGRFAANWPQLDQFNLMIVNVKSGYNNYFLDANEKYCPFGNLPDYDIVEEGFLITGKTGQIIQIPAPKQLNMITYKTNGALNDQGDLIAYTNIRYEGYRASEKRESLDDEDDLNKYFKKWIADRFPAAELDSFRVDETEIIEHPLVVSLYYRVPEYAQVVGDKCYLSAPLVSKIGKNPFHSPKRNFPVEFNYLSGWSENIRLTLPDGYAAEELPEPKVKKMNGVIYLCDCKKDGNDLVSRKQFVVKQMAFYPQEYEQLRAIYSDIISSEESQIVLSTIGGETE